MRFKKQAILARKSDNKQSYISNSRKMIINKVILATQDYIN